MTSTLEELQAQAQEIVQAERLNVSTALELLPQLLNIPNAPMPLTVQLFHACSLDLTAELLQSVPLEKLKGMGSALWTLLTSLSNESHERASLQNLCGLFLDASFRWMRCFSSQDILTPFHTPVVLAAMISHRQDIAWHFVLRKDILSISASLVDVESVLRYFYYGGMLCLALRRYERALDLFENCMMVPAFHVSSAYAVEAYKKHSLVSFLINGSIDKDLLHLFPSLRAVTRMVNEPSKSQRSPPSGNDMDYVPATESKAEALQKLSVLDLYLHLFQRLNEVKSMQDVEVLQVDFRTRQDVFQQDLNWELVQECFRSMRKHMVKRLARAYFTIPLSTLKTRLYGSIEDRLAIQNTKQLLHQMVADDVFKATIDGRAQTVDFLSTKDSDISAADIDERLQAIMVVNTHLLQLDKELLKHPAFIKKLTSTQDI